MSEKFYKITTAVSRRTGDWFFKASAWWVAAGYYFLFPGRVKNSIRFYRALFPDKPASYARKCAWHQYQGFTRIFLDRFLLEEGVEITYTSEGWQYLETAIAQKSGGILLMSHIGSWEAAARLLKKRGPDMPLMLYMGIRNKEQIERLQKESVASDDIRVIAADESHASPFDLIEGLSFLKSGGLVSMTGDRLWHSDQRAVKAEFLGHEVLLPETPHLLALLSGAPIFVLFTFRTGRRSYAFSVTPPFYVRAASRSERREAISDSVQHYADLLADAVRKHPLEWYHFEEFLGEKRLSC